MPAIHLQKPAAQMMQVDTLLPLPDLCIYIVWVVQIDKAAH